MLGLLAFGTMLALYAAIAFVIFGIAWVGITEGVSKAMERGKIEMMDHVASLENRVEKEG